ncbi:MAG: hypothetical protein AAGI89_10890 [Pseudomonadota bacterium]
MATPYERDRAGVDDVGLLDDSMPDQPRVGQAASAGSSFGLIGALVDAGVQANRQSRINKLVEENPVDAEAMLEKAITEKLGALGYNVSLIELPEEEREKRELLESYDGLTTSEPVEAYLDLVTTAFGYLSSGVGKPWRPTVNVDVRLVSVDDGEVLMENKLSYNPLAAKRGWSILLRTLPTTSVTSTIWRPIPRR